MPALRAALLDPKSVQYLHACSRCVRRAFLCGNDPFTGKNFEHRRQWIVNRIALLSQAYAIDICSYAIMSNHYHLVLYIDSKRAEDWSMDQVLRQYTKVFRGDDWVQQYLSGKAQPQEMLNLVKETAEMYRKRLMSISWFMRSINEPLARMANREDHCTGRFWEGRFKAQALLDESAILTCMAYVDLNPLRAGIANTPESSDYTSIQTRIIQTQTNKDSKSTPTSKAKKSKNNSNQQQLLPKLKPLLTARQQQSKHPDALPFRLKAYLELVDASARCIRTNKHSLHPDIPPIMKRLNIGLDAKNWVQTMKGIRKLNQKSAYAIGALEKLVEYSAAVTKKTKQLRAQFYWYRERPQPPE